MRSITGDVVVVWYHHGKVYDEGGVRVSGSNAEVTAQAQKNGDEWYWSDMTARESLFITCRCRSRMR